MVEGLLELNLILTNLLLFYIVVHCYQFKGNTNEFASSLNTRLDSLSKEVQEGGFVPSILLDIADLLEDSTGVQSIQMPKPTTGGGIQEMILGALMNRTSMARDNGPQTQNQIGEIHEGEFTETQEQMEERNEHTEPSDDVRST